MPQVRFLRLENGEMVQSRDYDELTLAKLVTGTIASVTGKSVRVGDTRLYLNDGYVTNAAISGGLIVNYLALPVTDTINGPFIAGVASTSNPKVQTVGNGTFAAGQLVQVSGSAQNNGLYEVLSHATNQVTIKGVGTTATVESFTQNQFIADSGAGQITRVTVAVLRAGTNGTWGVGSGSTTPFIFTDLVGTQYVLEKRDTFIGPGSGGSSNQYLLTSLPSSSAVRVYRDGILWTGTLSTQTVTVTVPPAIQVGEEIVVYYV